MNRYENLAGQNDPLDEQLTHALTRIRTANYLAGVGTNDTTGRENILSGTDYYQQQEMLGEPYPSERNTNGRYSGFEERIQKYQAGILDSFDLSVNTIRDEIIGIDKYSIAAWIAMIIAAVWFSFELFLLFV
jgi:hypothetical protein